MLLQGVPFSKASPTIMTMEHVRAGHAYELVMSVKVALSAPRPLSKAVSVGIGTCEVFTLIGQFEQHALCAIAPECHSSDG